MATSKPDIMVILLSKLMEEGDMFYKVRGKTELSLSANIQILLVFLLQKWMKQNRSVHISYHASYEDLGVVTFFPSSLLFS